MAHGLAQRPAAGNPVQLLFGDLSPGELYSLERSDSLMAGARWTAINSFEGQDASGGTVDSVGGDDTCYYRLRLDR
ncbi:MAG: hypothetical protein ACI9QL_002273 [Candidatus Omnitrophota bacterium]